MRCSKRLRRRLPSLKKDGSAGLEKVSKIRFGDGNYVFVNDLDGKTLMHIKPHLIGQVLLGLKDDTGKRFFRRIYKSRQEQLTEPKMEKQSSPAKAGFPTAGPNRAKKPSLPKISYVQGCLMGDANVYVGAGIYK